MKWSRLKRICENFTERVGHDLENIQDIRFMEQALCLAKESAVEGEVPVGCVIVRNGEVVGRGRNRRENKKSALAHAEIEAIAQANETLGGWRLWECTLYVTLEPCPMCAGAIINARIARVIYAASDEKYGACRSVCSLFDMNFNHRPVVETGILENDAKKMMQDFFRKLRMQLKTRTKWKKPIAPQSRQ